MTKSQLNWLLSMQDEQEQIEHETAIENGQA